VGFNVFFGLFSLFGIIPNAKLLILNDLFFLQQMGKYFVNGVAMAALPCNN
jgi:hypothetical protein